MSNSSTALFAGKSAVITGSTSGIGLAIARAFAGGGMNVMLNGFGEPGEIEAIRAGIEQECGVKVLHSRADMTKPDEIATMRELEGVGQAVLGGMAQALGIGRRWFVEHLTGEPTVLFRIFHYPPAPPDRDSPWGVGEHTDYGLVTILAQDDRGGLQVKVPAGWVDVPHVPGSLVCNIGDMLERLTGGRYRSTPHRVRNVSGADRLSFPFFLDPAWDATVEPLPSSAWIGLRTKTLFSMIPPPRAWMQRACCWKPTPAFCDCSRRREFRPRLISPPALRSRWTTSSKRRRNAWGPCRRIPAFSRPALPSATSRLCGSHSATRRSTCTACPTARAWRNITRAATPKRRARSCSTGSCRRNCRSVRRSGCSRRSPRSCPGRARSSVRRRW